MSNFLVELWEGIFTPGPTPTILIATNISFGALQLVLFLLLVATWSIHFVVLSALSAGLWGAINWFAAEYEAAKARGEIGQPEDKASSNSPNADANDKTDNADESRTSAPRQKHRKDDNDDTHPVPVPVSVDTQTPAVRQRNVADRVSNQSTEDEWEKVSGTD